MNGRRVLVGVSGGVAAYKAATLVSRLVQQGAEVQVVMTDAATRFIGEATFAALTGRPVARRIFEEHAFPLGAHIELATGNELLCVAPATADFLARTATGAAPDLLSTLYLSFVGPVLFAPAMNCEMWEKRAVQRNVETLREDGVQMVGPAAGWLSCRRQGAGRMAEPEQLLEAIQAALAAADAGPNA